MSAVPERIVVFCLPGIGDAILYTPAFAALRATFPRAHVTAVVMFQGAADLLRHDPHVDDVQWFDFFHAGLFEGLRYVWRLRRQGCDLAILGFPANRLEYNVLNRLVGRRWRAGHRYRRQRWRNLAALNDVWVDEDLTRHNVEENLALVRAVAARVGVSAPVTSTALEVHLTDDDSRAAQARLTDQGIRPDEVLVGFHTYSSTFKNMHRKCWPPEHFAALIERLGEVLPGARAVLVSGPSDGPVNAEIMRRTKAKVAVIAEPNLRVVMGVLRRCRVFVSNDSALMHLAAALDVPVVALFGPTNPERLHPWTGTYRLVRRDLPCMPCFEYSSRPLQCAAGLDYACMRELPVDAVLASIGELTRGAERGGPPRA